MIGALGPIALGGGTPQNSFGPCGGPSLGPGAHDTSMGGGPPLLNLGGDPLRRGAHIWKKL